jgi:hypothetical protein
LCRPSQNVVDILGEQLDHDGVTTVVEGDRGYVDQEAHDIDLDLCAGSMAGEGGHQLITVHAGRLTGRSTVSAGWRSGQISVTPQVGHHREADRDVSRPARKPTITAAITQMARVMGRLPSIVVHNRRYERSKRRR